MKKLSKKIAWLVVLFCMFVLLVAAVLEYISFNEKDVTKILRAPGYVFIAAYVGMLISIYSLNEDSSRTHSKGKLVFYMKLFLTTLISVSAGFMIIIIAGYVFVGEDFFTSVFIYRFHIFFTLIILTLPFSMQK